MLSLKNLWGDKMEILSARWDEEEEEEEFEDDW